MRIRISQWEITGWLSLCIRFVQGWIFWSGGSRRFIYDPEKLNPHAPEWMANKLQSAMPGSLFDLSSVISFLLEHFILLYTAIILFSLLELISGLGLILGFFTRAFAMSTVFISIILMLIFGWQGGTCIDEWTMAVSNLSMGLTLFLMGGTTYSIDAILMRRYPAMSKKPWFLFLNSGEWSRDTIKNTALFCLAFTILFTVGTYNYYRGAVISHYHAGPTSPTLFHLNLRDGKLKHNGEVQFEIAVDAGPSNVPYYIMRIELFNSEHETVAVWNEKMLSTLPQFAIKNRYDYNKVSTGQYGLVAPESSKATITLSTLKKESLPAGHYKLQITTIDGKQWELNI